MAIETITTLALHVREFYARTFLENLKKNLKFEDFVKDVKEENFPDLEHSYEN